MEARVLLASDNAGQRKLIADALDLAGFTVIAAEDGPECLLRATLEDPDLVIVEANMLLMDGIAVLRALRASPQTAELPVIMLTRRLGSGDVPLELRTEREVYLAKPLKIGKLISTARALLHSAQAHDGRVPAGAAAVPTSHG
jgi:DNA-binding response OmpR family regulator